MEAYFGFYWSKNKLSFSEYAIYLKKILTSLKNTKAVVSDFKVIGTQAGERLPAGENLSELKDSVRKSISHTDQKFTDTDEAGFITDCTLAPHGFTCHLEAHSCFNDSKIQAKISYSDGYFGEKPVKNRLICKFIYQENSPSAVKRLHVNDSFHSLISLLSPEYARISNPDFNEAISPEQVTCIDWLTYLSHLPPDQVPARAELLGMGISWEAVPQGGTLFMLDQEMVSADNPEHVARGKLLRARLMEHGWIEN
ncbi:Imm52 family immunity protein [Massilia sp. W12]|uniref:Imm52 family immunity protein n=1 Tax=Massilia sp. W12 TaxID=3126507 RepID=UPI0030CAF705